jgi:uncharacterized membrane-anchored protein YhcB (DUF1043 family)
MSLVYGLIIGIIFGFLLQKAQVLKYRKQKWLLISNPI